MSVIRFIIPGKLRGKGRPRFGNGVVFTDAQTEATEAMIRQYAALAMRGQKLIEGPVMLAVRQSICYPQSWSEKKKAEIIYVTGHPDSDNVIKGLSDALNGIVFKDDAQVSVLDFARRYTDGPEQTVVSIYDLTAPPFQKVAV